MESNFDSDRLKRLLAEIRPLHQVTQSPLDENRYENPCQNLQFRRSPSGKIVWYRNLKAASSTYDLLFDVLDWTHCKMSTIDWDQDIVIGHIRDPLTRYRKGIVEGLYGTRLQHLISSIDLYNIKDWMEFIDGLLMFDTHTATLEFRLQNRSKLVHWVPIDIDMNHKQYTLDLLEQHREHIHAKIKKWFVDDCPDLYTSTETKSKFFLELMKIDPSDKVKYYLDFDQCLYAATVAFYSSQHT